MTKKNLLSTVGILLVAFAGILWAADHIEAPGVASTTSDITDFYAFQSSADNDNMVFVCNIQGLLSPTATADARFDENVMIEFNIDNTGDNVEDLVIQALVKDGELIVYGPIAPSMTGLNSAVEDDGTTSKVDVTTYGASANIGTDNNMKIFAGPRDDPFFMDFTQYGEIIAGNAPQFNNPGTDTFAGTNVMSIVIEVPKSELGSTDVLRTWVESKRKI